MEKKQPGVMLYFDIRPCLNRMSRQEQGELFVAILDYAQYGVVPEMDGLLGVAWDFIQPRLDRDRDRYDQITEKRARAAAARWEKNNKQDAKADGAMQMDANADFALQTMPTTTPNTNTSSSTSTPTTTAATPTSTSAPTTTTTGRTRDAEFEDLRRQRMGMLK